MNKVLIEYYKVKKEHDFYLRNLEKEVQRIVSVIKSVFKCNSMHWLYQEEGNVDSLPRDIYDDAFPILIDQSCDSGVWNYQEAIPISFFDMSNEEIKNHIEKEISDSRELEKIKRLKEKESVLKRKELKKSIINKLTKEEIKILGIYKK